MCGNIHARKCTQVQVQLEICSNNTKYSQKSGIRYFVFSKKVSQIDSVYWGVLQFSPISPFYFFEDSVLKRIIWVSLVVTFSGVHALAFLGSIHGIQVCRGQIRYIQIVYFAYMCVWKYTDTSTGTTRNMPNNLFARTGAIFTILCFLTHV